MRAREAIEGISRMDREKIGKAIEKGNTEGDGKG